MQVPAHTKAQQSAGEAQPTAKASTYDHKISTQCTEVRGGRTRAVCSRPSTCQHTRLLICSWWAVSPCHCLRPANACCQHLAAVPFIKWQLMCTGPLQPTPHVTQRCSKGDVRQSQPPVEVAMDMCLGPLRLTHAAYYMRCMNAVRHAIRSTPPLEPYHNQSQVNSRPVRLIAKRDFNKGTPCRGGINMVAHTDSLLSVSQQAT